MNIQYQNFLLIYRGGIAGFYLAGLRSKGNINKASYFVDTVKIWNPASRLEESLMSTSTEFFIDKNKELESFEGDLTNFKRFCFTAFNNWYIDKKRKDQPRYEKTVELSIKDYYNLEDETDNAEQHLIIKENQMQQIKDYDIISTWLKTVATENERFIYDTMLGLREVVWNESHMHVLNFPGRPVSKVTYFKYKKKLKQKLVSLMGEKSNE